MSEDQFVLIFVWREAGVQLHSVACGCPTVPAQLIGETVLSPLTFLGVLAKSQLNTGWEVYFFGFSVLLC